MKDERSKKGSVPGRGPAPTEPPPRYSHFAEWACPGCGTVVRARGASEVIHECAKRNNRVTSFKRVGATAVAS